MLKLAVLNVSRRKKSTAMAIVITALAVLVAVLVSCISVCFHSGLEISEQRMGADVIIYPNEAEIDDTQFLYSGMTQMVYMDASVIDHMLPEESIEHITPQFFLQTLPDAGCCSTNEEQRIVGIEKESDFIISSWYDIGNFEADDMLIGQHTSWHVDMNVLLLGNVFSIVDKIPSTGTSIDHSVIVDLEAARQMAAERFAQDQLFDFEQYGELDNLVTCYLIKLKDGVSPDAFVEEVKKNGIDAQISSVSSARSSLSDQMANLSRILFAFVAVVVFLSCLALYSQFANLIGKMQREIGYLRSIGLRKKDVLLLILAQVGMMSGIGGMVGGIAGVALFYPAIEFLQNLFVIPVGEWGIVSALAWIAAGVVVALLIGLLSAMHPIWKSVHMDPTKAISEGEL